MLHKLLSTRATVKQQQKHKQRNTILVRAYLLLHNWASQLPAPLNLP
jgi:hypothetical protein